MATWCQSAGFDPNWPLQGLSTCVYTGKYSEVLPDFIILEQDNC